MWIYVEEDKQRNKTEREKKKQTHTDRPKRTKPNQSKPNEIQAYKWQLNVRETNRKKKRAIKLIQSQRLSVWWCWCLPAKHWSNCKLQLYTHCEQKSISVTEKERWVKSSGNANYYSLRSLCMYVWAVRDFVM